MNAKYIIIIVSVVVGLGQVNQRALMPALSAKTNTGTHRKEYSALRKGTTPGIMRKELEGLKGGSKQFWLRIHRGEVERFLALHGENATCREFNMEPDTLERFQQRKADDVKLTKLSQADRTVLSITMAGIRDLKARVRDLEEFRDEAMPAISLINHFVEASGQQIQKIIVSHRKQLKPDPLRIDNPVEKLRKLN